MCRHQLHIKCLEAAWNLIFRRVESPLYSRTTLISILISDDLNLFMIFRTLQNCFVLLRPWCNKISLLIHLNTRIHRCMLYNLVLLHTFYPAMNRFQYILAISKKIIPICLWHTIVFTSIVIFNFLYTSILYY
jgi:hypothetical protein